MGQIKVRTKYQRMAAQDKNAYVGRVMTFSRIPTNELIEHASRASGIPEAIMGASFTAIATQVEELLMNGHSISLGNLGTMRMSVSCKAVEDENDISSTNVKRRRILLTPSPALKAKLNMVNITTETEDGKVVDNTDE